MARLKQRDADAGAVDQSLSDEQKAAIADARSMRTAKAAELEILHRSTLAATFDPADRQKLEDQYRDELRRLNDELDRKVGRIRAPRD